LVETNILQVKNISLLLFVLSLSLLVSASTSENQHINNSENTSGCDRKKLEGLYTYTASPTTFVLREANKMIEKLGDIGVITEYSIRWQSKATCDHQLIVTKVTTTSRTPASYKPYLLAVGDTFNITVLDVTDKHLAFRTRWRDRVTQEVMDRIPMDSLKVK